MNEMLIKKNGVFVYITDKELQEFALYHMPATSHCAKCECFNVNQVWSQKGVHVFILPEQDPDPDMQHTMQPMKKLLFFENVI